MVDLCALDTTRDEIRNAFGWNASDLTNDNLHSSWKSLLGAMRTSASKGYQMKSANQISAFGWNASDLTIDNLHSSWKSLLGTSASKGYQMKSANRIYCSLPLVDGFTAKANDFYGADAQ
eukprot:PhF_6_TR25504/c2_g4_i1/m.35560